VRVHPCLSVCLSVCPSVCLHDKSNTTENTITCFIILLSFIVCFFLSFLFVYVYVHYVYLLFSWASLPDTKQTDRRMDGWITKLSTGLVHHEASMPPSWETHGNPRKATKMSACKLMLDHMGFLWFERGKRPRIFPRHVPMGWRKTVGILYGICISETTVTRRTTQSLM